jgi:hypothetical protein
MTMKKWFWMMAMICGVAAHAACGGMSAMEQAFMSGMTPANQEMFCSRFDQSMRDAAMNMSGTPDADGNMMTPDQSVEKVARDRNLAPSTGKGGCSVK